jgi:riboflavin transporter FmnP
MKTSPLVNTIDLAVGVLSMWTLLVFLHITVIPVFDALELDFIHAVPTLPDQFGFQFWDSGFQAAILLIPLLFLNGLINKSTGKRVKKKSLTKQRHPFKSP